MIKILRLICLSLFLLNTHLFSVQDLNNQLQEHIKYSSDGTNHVGHILIDDRTSGITDATWLYVKKALDHYKESKPIFIILELNTPGGEVYAAQKISDALKEMDIQSDIPVVTFINNWAISAGAMLAYSTRFIAITKDASMGAAEPVLSTQTGEMKEASEKINSAMRADFANRAQYFDRNPFIAEGMVDKDIILVQRDGQIIKVDTESQIKSTDIIIKAKGKLLTLNAQQLMDDKVANILLPPTKLPFITEQEREAGKWSGEKMLLFQNSFFKEIPKVEIDSYRMDWKTKFFVFLANPVVASVLLLGLMMGFYMEMNHPGLGFPALIALICLFLIILSNLSLQIANWLEVIFLLTGLLLIIVDLFVLPTFGLLGFIGALLFIGGLFAMMLPGISNVDFDYDTSTFNAAGIVFIERLAMLCATLVLGILLMLLIGRYVTPKLGVWSKLVLTGHEQEGYVAGWNPEKLPKVGTAGEVVSTLRPAGKVTIENDIFDAITDGTFLEKGTAIIVKRIEGSVLVVEEDIKNQG